MSLYRCALLLFVFWMTCESQRTSLDNGIRAFRTFRELYFNILGKTSTPGGWQLNNARNGRRLQRKINSNIQFPCNLTNTRSRKPPVSVHKLRPGDIDVVAAMGDSLTAGFGAVAMRIPFVLVENRGISWSGGGQSTWKEYLTLPNIIKVFNPNVIGYALADAFTTHKASQFNVAEGFAMSRDLPFMAEILIKRMKSDPRVDLKRHWKLITIMIGSNDFCTEMCYQHSPWEILEKHRKDLINTFRFLKKNLPRTIISLVTTPNLQTMVEFIGRSPYCEIANDFECSCLFGLRWRHQRKEFYAIIREWQKIEEEFGTMLEFQTEDFAVVSQPFTINASFPVLDSGLTDWSYLSADCFHLSQKSYAKAANALWNNLLEPVGKKSRNWTEVFERFLCPTAKRPYISTFRNS